MKLKLNLPEMQGTNKTHLNGQCLNWASWSGSKNKSLNKTQTHVKCRKHLSDKNVLTMFLGLQRRTITSWEPPNLDTSTFLIFDNFSLFCLFFLISSFYWFQWLTTNKLKSKCTFPHLSKFASSLGATRQQEVLPDWFFSQWCRKFLTSCHLCRSWVAIEGWDIELTEGKILVTRMNECVGDSSRNLNGLILLDSDKLGA